MSDLCPKITDLCFRLTMWYVKTPPNTAISPVFNSFRLTMWYVKPIGSLTICS
ncbi:Uncharacterised protein [Clostridioides difficile]|uniref:Uncharacterized protein n=1 Tax=Clostridioides difficile TaxID=1496 RepID=A0A069A7C7_CLODI|nr:hypothetical protein [Clostridioides difficile]CDS85283.1 hypothetical protein BN1097_450014 [Clostridioides difficile]SJQ09866.1 Uncharacterised protein [Clostridioides difficile]SJR67135.1 Uncharacterised protein [Clostridioides difficile]VFG30191.1 Uncharacterised protein [Clostridioides difficile]